MGTALAVGALAMVAASASAQKQSGAETGLVGVKLYDPALKVINMFGSPDEIQPVVLGGGGASGMGGARGGGSGSPFGGSGFPGAPGMGSGMSGGMGRGGGGRSESGGSAVGGASFDLNGPFGLGNEVLKQMGGPGGMTGYPGAPSGYPGLPSSNPGAPGMRGSAGGGMSGRGGYPGMPGGLPGVPGGGSMSGYPGMPGGSGMPGMSGMPGAGAGGGRMGSASGLSASAVTYTRWVYNRSGSKYGFIIDKAGRVVQVEAIGLSNPRVNTRKGVHFGTDFATIIKRYGNPESYDISGDNITMKYLTKNKVAFRLARLAEKKPHQVTAIVVAAGKG